MNCALLQPHRQADSAQSRRSDSRFVAKMRANLADEVAPRR